MSKRRTSTPGFKILCGAQSGSAADLESAGRESMRVRKPPAPMNHGMRAIYVPGTFPIVGWDIRDEGPRPVRPGLYMPGDQV